MLTHSQKGRPRPDVGRQRPDVGCRVHLGGWARSCSCQTATGGLLGVIGFGGCVGLEEVRWEVRSPVGSSSQRKERNKGSYVNTVAPRMERWGVPGAWRRPDAGDAEAPPRKTGSPPSHSSALGRHAGSGWRRRKVKKRKY